jgi:hypothetical protein
VKEQDWEAEQIGDGDVHVRIRGENHLIHLHRPVGAGPITARDVQEAVQTLLAQRALGQLRAKLSLEQDRLDELTKAAGRTNPVAPPAFAELAISLLAPKNSAQALLGDLQEMFQKNAARFGEQQARRKYWLQVAGSLGPLLWHWLKRIGFFTILLDYFRSKLGL